LKRLKIHLLNGYSMTNPNNQRSLRRKGRGNGGPGDVVYVISIQRPGSQIFRENSGSLGVDEKTFCSFKGIRKGGGISYLFTLKIPEGDDQVVREELKIEGE